MEISEVKNELIELGKKVAKGHSPTTHFPEWCLLKIGIQTVQGIPYDIEYYESLLEENVSYDEQS